MANEWREKDFRWKYVADYKEGETTALYILMCPLTGNRVELSGAIKGRPVAETFALYGELRAFLGEHNIPMPYGYRAAWKSQHEKDTSSR